MTKWKLSRIQYGAEEFTFKEGDEITIGRAVGNTLALSSLVISRKHCIIRFLSDKAFVTDLGSSNGVYVGVNKIAQNSPHELKNSDNIGIGWTMEAFIRDKITDEQKYMFKLTREDDASSVVDRFQFQQSDNELDEIEEQIAALDPGENLQQKQLSPIHNTKLSLKRKSDQIKCHEIKKEIKDEKRSRIITMDDDVILLSDSDNETLSKDRDGLTARVKLESISEESHKEPLKDQIKCENKYLEFEAFNVKQEYMGYDDEEPIKIDSDSDSESEHWYLRLSQNSPGKPLSKVPKAKAEEKVEEGSYSQMDDDFVIDLSYTDNDNEEEFSDDIITILPPPVKSPESNIAQKKMVKQVPLNEEFIDEGISLHDPETIKSPAKQAHQPSCDEIDGSKRLVPNQIETITTDCTKSATSNDIRKTQMIEPRVHSHKGKTKHAISDSKSHRSSSKHGKVKKHSSKKHISNSQKEERKKKLKEIATKVKEAINQSVNISTSTTKSTSNVKITNSNRGAFLTDSVQVVKPSKRKDTLNEEKSKKIVESPKNDKQEGGSQSPEDRENKGNQSSKSHSKRKEHKSSKNKRQEKQDTSKIKSPFDKSSNMPESRVPLKSLKPLAESDETFSGKPFSKVDPLPPKKPKKSVRFSETGPEVHLFEIEPGNQMKKTSSVKNSLVDIRQMPVFSLEKKTLMNILKWNPHWLEEQIKNNDPPPILGHNNPPLSIFHSFVNHHQYVQLVGDLLLMEIWECLTLSYMKIRGQNMDLQMQIESLPPTPTPERCYELFSFSVNISMPSHDTKRVPRVGEILLSTFGPERTQRFFYVNNVRCLPSPPNNIHTFYSIGLHAIYTKKMETMRQGEVIMGRSLAYINKELNLFEAMEYLAGSPLGEAILRPEPRHFQTNPAPSNSVSIKWIQTLNPSQQAAVSSSVAAALGDKPCIQMVQGPPGTGKSSVICAIVMSYFYNEEERRRPNRGKIMICATSNAAVDELVIRLLNIRQNLPKSERFRMVRVGRAEAMAARARDVSSQQLAQRDAARLLAAEPAPRHGLHEEISHLEAKINMWKTAAQDAKDPVRVAYCQGRVNDLLKRVTLIRVGGGVPGGEELRPDQLVAAERRIIEGADIIVTTLASAYNHKMRGLKRRVALCIMDEAGQAIEPESLLPLTLDVTHLTLIGDPQQLPGYICSQRAKRHGLGESLFSRLTSNCEHWPSSPVALLDQQYRMHADIADYPNRAFYGGLVRSAALPRPALPLPPYLLLSISSGDKGQGACGGNEMEACGVARLVGALAAALRPRTLSLAVITPYHAHKDLIKRNLRLLQGPSETPVEVNTVDSFQGQERDVVVVSLARSHGVGFLTDAGRMNVMLTRARHALLVCLNPHAMLKNDQWRTLIEDARNRKMYRMLPNDMCQPITPGHVARDDILKYVASPK